jgi:ABC-type Zn2+ transport system substrate-binding protein/surface adhesin
MRLYYFIILVIITTLNNNIFAIQIIASNNAIGSIIRFVEIPNIELDILVQNQCPHTYTARPSDLLKIQKSDIIVYIDDNFEPFIKLLTKNYDNQLINLSHKLKIAKTQNMHIWLSLDYSYKIIQTLEALLNVDNTKALLAISDLIELRNERFKTITEVALINPSLEYIFENTNVKIHRLYSKNNAGHGLKQVQKLDDFKQELCVITSNPDIYTTIHNAHPNSVYYNDDLWSIEGYKALINEIANKCK